MAVTVEQPNVVSELTGGLGLGDHEEAERRVYELLAKQGRPAQVAAVARLRQLLRKSDDNEHILLAASVLEAVSRLDPSLIDIDTIEELASSEDFSKRF